MGGEVGGHDGALVDHVDCPHCLGEAGVKYFGGMNEDGTARDAMCSTCGGLGKLPRDHPGLEFEECPHCGAEVEVSTWGAMEASACPGCGEPVYLGGLDGGLQGCSWGDVTF